MESLTVLSLAAMCKSRLILSLVAMQSTKNSTNLHMSAEGNVDAFEAAHLATSLIAA